MPAGLRRERSNDFGKAMHVSQAASFNDDSIHA